jgi:diguanylate cyclase (GGDEF)-like protein/PAS domain S-box-containing protein
MPRLLAQVQWAERTIFLWNVSRVADANVVSMETMDATTRRGSEPSRRKISSIASLAVYGMSPVAIGAFLWLRSEGLIADTPLWKLVIALVVCGVANLTTGIAASRRPGSRVWLHGRVAASAIGTAVVIYMTGWGSMLVVAYAVGSAELLRTVGPSSWRIGLGWTFVAVVGGEAAIALGWAPSLIHPALGHAVAFASTACLYIVIRVLGHTAEAKEAAEEEIRSRGEHFESLIRHAADMIGVIRSDGVVTSLSPAVAPLLGYLPTDVEGTPFAEMLHRSERMRIATLLGEVMLAPGSSHTTELRMRHRDHTDRLVVATFTNPQGDRAGDIIVNVHDITTQRQLEERLRHDAMHDPLTGLLNRGAFLESLHRACARADRDGHQLGVLYIDLDGFKQINDTFGHGIGDIVLVEAAHRLRANLRDGETIGRLGGDEFIVLLEGVPSREIVVEIADRLLSALERPIVDLPEVPPVSASIGIALCAPNTHPAAEVLNRADDAMYSAKRDGRGRWALSEVA